MPSLFTFANNVSTTLAGAISSTATSLTLSSAAHLPTSIPAGKALVITLNDQATRQQFEVIYATSITGATLSGLQRGQEGTTAQAWSAGDYAYCAPTMGQMQAFGQLGDTNTWTGPNTWNAPGTFVDPLAVGNASLPGHALALGQLASLIGPNGYLTIPTYYSGALINLFLEWGATPIVPGSGTATVTFAAPFVNKLFAFVPVGGKNITNQGSALVAGTSSLTVGALVNIGPNQVDAGSYIAIGY